NNLRLDDILAIVRAYRSQTQLPLLARPGVTSTIECEFNPHELAGKVSAFADAGVTLLGVCCGATPAHVAALRKEIDRLGLAVHDCPDFPLSFTPQAFRREPIPDFFDRLAATTAALVPSRFST